MGRTDVFSFNVELGAEWVNRTSMCREPSELTHGPVVECAQKLYREFRYADDVSPLAIEGLLLEMAVALHRKERPGSQPPIERARQLIDARFLEPLSLSEIANCVSLSPAALAQAFRRRYHRSPGDYLRSLRLMEARRMVATTTNPLCQIAMSCGFADQSHMTRLFVREFAVTPAHYRRLAQ